MVFIQLLFSFWTIKDNAYDASSWNSVITLLPGPLLPEWTRHIIYKGAGGRVIGCRDVSILRYVNLR